MKARLIAVAVVAAVCLGVVVTRAVWEGRSALHRGDQAHSAGLEDSVLFAGSVSYEQVQRYLGAATCCVAPFLSGRGEASPLKLFDYMAAGRPIVASAIPSIRDLLEAAASIVAVPPENASRLAIGNDSDRVFVRACFFWTSCRVDNHIAAEGRKRLGRIHFAANINFRLWQR